MYNTLLSWLVQLFYKIQVRLWGNLLPNGYFINGCNLRKGRFGLYVLTIHATKPCSYAMWASISLMLSRKHMPKLILNGWGI